MDEHIDERLNENDQDKEFEQFLRQFTLRAAAPLPESAVASHNGRGLWTYLFTQRLAWMRPTPRWALATVCLLAAIGLPFALLRGPLDPVDPVKPTASGTIPQPGAAPDDTAQLLRISMYEQASLKISADLGGSDRYLTHVTTDKPIYRIGETLYVRGVVLRADGHVPMADPQGMATIEIKDPKGGTVTSGASPITDSTLSFVWTIPDGQAGGEYTIRVAHPSTGNAPAERKFDIRAYRAPRLKSQIAFLRDGYGPGDTVSASLHVERAEGGTPIGAKVSVSANVDGQEVWNGVTTVDWVGNAGASFKLPLNIARGEGTLAMVIEDGGTVEPATKTIPILLRTLDLGIYPEGGDLIAGLPNRVYIEGKTPAKKPADMAGVVVNAAGTEVATFRTEHEGRGRFAFTPVKGESYSLRVTQPAGIRTVFPLPKVKDSGVTIAATSDIIPREKDVLVRVAATNDGVYDVVLSQRGKEIAFTSVKLKAGQSDDVTLTVPRPLDGVLVATVYDDHQTPMAERLLFRQPDRNLKVRVTADRADYVPGDKVTLRVATTDDNGKPVGAVVGLTVTDSSVLEMIEKREQSPRLPVMALLENDVRNLSDAHVYLDPSNPKAPLATDLLLGTQGWRRFATVDPTKFVGANGDAARRALAIRVPPPPPPVIRNAKVPLIDGTLAGVVVDELGARLPSVLVRAVNETSGVVSATALTDDEGIYRFAVPPGSYTVITEFVGINRTETHGVPMRASGSRADVVLEIGDVALRMAVDAKRPQGNLFGFADRDRNPMAFYSGSVARNRAEAAVVELAQANQLVDRLQNLQNAVGRVEKLEKQRVQNARQDLADLFDLELDQQQRNQFEFERLERRLIRPRVVIREYAHPLRPNWTEGSRTDFTETVYWNAGVKTDASTGLGTVSFNLSDTVTSFRVLADGFTPDGTLGSGVSSIESVRPFYIEPKLPLQVTSGDIIQLPVGLINGMSRDLNGAGIAFTPGSGLKVTLPADMNALRAKERARQIVRIDVSQDFSGATDLQFDGKAGSYRDTVSRKLDVQPRGYPREASTGGMLSANAEHSFEFTLPAAMIPGSVATNVVVYPTPLANMTEALQSLLQQPNGCFEQTSSTSYPMVMAQQYFVSHVGVDPGIIQKASGFLDASYKKLTGFETSSRGYEWFGADPGHEALTAYGLMQFTDMSQVRDVDKAMVQRTREWLLARRDGNGGFTRNSKALDSFGRAPQETTNAYITWALVESGEKGLAKEIAAVKASANAATDSYIVALAANTLHATGDVAGARQLMDKLAKAQDASGAVRGASTSITQSGGESLAIEATALSALAWMREPSYSGNVEKAVRWIVASNKNGRFGSTQATVLALRAVVAYDAAHARPKAPGRLILIVDGKPVGASLAFTPDTKGALNLPNFGGNLEPGKHSVVLRMEAGAEMPFSIDVKYHTDYPDSAEQTKIGIQVALRDTQVREGGVTEAVVSIANKSDGVIPTPVAIVGIPGGLEVRHDQLKELVKSGKIAAYEVIGREVVLYWRSIKAKDKFDLSLSLVAAVPGVYTGPASRAYLYYTDEDKNWAPGVRVNITPR